VSTQLKKYSRIHNVKGFVHSVDVVGCGASDPEVFELVKKNKAGLITLDKRFALNTLRDGYPVVIPDELGGVLIKPIIERSPKHSDPLTYHLLENDEVVMP